MNILVPIDFSDASRTAIEVALEQARAHGARVWLLHVAAPDPAFVGFEAGPDVVRDQRAETLRSEHRELSRLAEIFRNAGTEATPLLIQGETVETILDQAERRGADLIVMATHGRGLMYQLVVGSVSEGVLHRSRVPILMVPARS